MISDTLSDAVAEIDEYLETEMYKNILPETRSLIKVALNAMTEARKHLDEPVDQSVWAILKTNKLKYDI